MTFFTGWFVLASLVLAIPFSAWASPLACELTFTDTGIEWRADGASKADLTAWSGDGSRSSPISTDLSGKLAYDELSKFPSETKCTGPYSATSDYCTLKLTARTASGEPCEADFDYYKKERLVREAVKLTALPFAPREAGDLVKDGTIPPVLGRMAAREIELAPGVIGSEPVLSPPQPAPPAEMEINGDINIVPRKGAGFWDRLLTPSEIRDITTIPDKTPRRPRADIVFLGFDGRLATLPVAFSYGMGFFKLTNKPVDGLKALLVLRSRVGFAIGDFNGDGKADMLAMHRGSNTAQVVFSNGDGTFRVTNEPVGEFAVWAAEGGTLREGDFNGDGKTDIALTGVPGWATVPVAFSNGDGTFKVTNEPVGEFAVWATETEYRNRMTGDFNGDGKTDIALVGVPGWATVPVAFSNGDGTFKVTNEPVGEFAVWAAAKEPDTGASAYTLAEDFNGDGKTDIAVGGNSGWNTLPVAFSNGDGTFRVTNQKTVFKVDGLDRGFASFSYYTSISSVRPAAGDFNGDGKADIALAGGTGMGWNTVPVAFSNGDGTFKVTNETVGEFNFWNPWDKGDFNGDGKTDILLTARDNYDTLPIAFSNGDGTFKVTNNRVEGLSDLRIREAAPIFPIIGDFN